MVEHGMIYTAWATRSTIKHQQQAACRMLDLAVLIYSLLLTGCGLAGGANPTPDRSPTSVSPLPLETIAIYRANLQRTGVYVTSGVPPRNTRFWTYQPLELIWSPLVVADGAV